MARLNGGGEQEGRGALHDNYTVCLFCLIQSAVIAAVKCITSCESATRH